MIKIIPLVIYFPGDSLLHRLQARTKLLLLLWIVCSLVVANQREWHFAPYLLMIGLLIVGMAVSGIGWREFAGRMWFLIALTFASALFALFANQLPDVPVLYTLGPVAPLYGYVQLVARVAIGVCAVSIGTSWLPILRPLWRPWWMQLLRVGLCMLVLVALFFLWLTGDTPANKPFTLGPVLVTYRGVWLFVTSFVMFVVLYTCSLLLAMTTLPVALIEGLTALLSPLRRLKLPVDDFALMVLLALRFFPTLVDEVEQLMKAQMARGADMTHGSLRERFHSFVVFFPPLITATLRRASELATALDARGYRSNTTATCLHEAVLSREDYLCVTGVIVLTIIAFLL